MSIKRIQAYLRGVYMSKRERLNLPVRNLLVRSILNFLFYYPIICILLILVRDKNNYEKLRQKVIKKLNKIYLDPYLGLVKPLEDGIFWKRGKITGYNATSIIKSIFIDNVYPKPKCNNIVIDVGAHIGLYSIYSSSYAERVIAIEPETTNFNHLIINIQSYKNIYPLKMALGDENRKMRLFLHDSWGHSLLFPSSQFEEVLVRKLDDVIEKLDLRKVDLIKINAEGYELKILKGAEKTIRKFKPILAIGIHHYEKEAQEIFSYLNEVHDKDYEIDINQRNLIANPR